MKIGWRWFWVLFLGLIFFGIPEIAFANNENNPPGGIQVEGVFQVPNGSKSKVIRNDILDIVEITSNQKNQPGAVWNTNANMMDFTKDFKTSMYFYFGDKGKNAADGMAFVMQADKNGNIAFRTGDSERLAVWDSAKSGEWNLAIANSLAIEFDTKFNTEFDNGLDSNRNHIAWNYPGQQSSYEDYASKKRRLIHKDVQYVPDNFLSDDKWHRFEVSWDVNQSILTYKFDSLETISIKLDVQATFGTTSVFWGVTGYTGSTFSSNRVVFDEVPGLVNGRITEEIIDKSTGLSVRNKDVRPDTLLTQSVDVNYFSGKQNWKNIDIKKQISDKVTYIPGSLRLIDNMGNQTILEDSAINFGSYLLFNIGDLDLNNNKKIIQFDVKVKQVDTDKNIVESSIAQGRNYSIHSLDFNYRIISNIPPVITLDKAGQEVEIMDGEGIDIKGKWLDKNSESINLFYQLNENTPVLYSEAVPNVPKDTEHEYLTNIPANELAIGKNVLKVWAVDNEGTQSNIENLSINVKGTLKFESIPNFNFGSIPLSSATSIIFPVTAEKIILSDTRGNGGSWEVKAKLKKGFTSIEGYPIDSFYYINKNNQKQLLQLDEWIHIESGVTQDSKIQEIEWQANQGLSIEVNSSNYVGSYSSEIEWVLEDAPVS